MRQINKKQKYAQMGLAILLSIFIGSLVYAEDAVKCKLDLTEIGDWSILNHVYHTITIGVEKITYEYPNDDAIKVLQVFKYYGEMVGYRYLKKDELVIFEFKDADIIERMNPPTPADHDYIVAELKHFSTVTDVPKPSPKPESSQKIRI